MSDGTKEFLSADSTLNGLRLKGKRVETTSLATLTHCRLELTGSDNSVIRYGI